MLTLLTPTGRRQKQFELCEKWIARQTLQDFNWIVDDDCDPVTATTLGQRVIRTQCPHLGCTLGWNVRRGLEEGPFDRLLIIEDDCWYHPEYLATMNELFDHGYDLNS